MEWVVEFSKEADIDFNKIRCFFEVTGVVERFQKDFLIQMKRIEFNPYQFQIRYRDIRLVHLKKFNYTIHYKISNETIVVLRILNQKQSY